MNCQVRTWWLSLRVLALALALTAIPLPGLAGEVSQPAARPALLTSAQKIAASIRLAPSKSQSTGTQEGRAKLSSPSFFKTKVGITVIAVMAIGTGYAVYSAKNDRIHSPGR